ncbi:hypothetical protein V6Z11_A12G015900 [Gossypium hirsutum]
MGAFLSSNYSRAGTSEPLEVSQNETCKRQKLSTCLCDENPRLIPCLPDEVSYQILARVPRINYLNARLVSRSWKASIMSSELFNIRKELGTTEEWLYILTKKEGDKPLWYALDPLSRRWLRLPPMPNVTSEDESRKGLNGLRMWNVVGSSIKIADVIRGWLVRKDALDSPLCGCAIGAVNGCLYVLGGFSRASALRCVWQYNPVLNSWSELYVVGGVTRGPGGLTPLQSAEVFDSHTGLTSYRGRLFVPQSLYCWPFFVDVGGEVYDPEVNSWVEMPVGMGEGWPARQAGMKLSVTVDGELYALDPSSSLESARVKVYDYQDDAWKFVVGEVPIPNFTDSESPYVLAGLLGKLHVITKDANNNILVLQTDVRNHCTSLSPASSDNSSCMHSESAESATGLDTDIWRVVATRTARCFELVSCQTLSI